MSFWSMMCTDTPNRVYKAEPLAYCSDTEKAKLWIQVSEISSGFSKSSVLLWASKQVVHSKPNLFKVTWGNGLQVALARPPNLRAAWERIING